MTTVVRAGWKFNRKRSDIFFRVQEEVIAHTLEAQTHCPIVTGVGNIQRCLHQFW